MTFSLAGYDSWIDNDIVGDILWREEYLREWTQSMVKLDHPYLSDEDVVILAEERMQTGYYDNYDF